MKILISGAGIAGPTLAYWLARYGLKPTLIEAAPQLRTGGYIIDFWGAGIEIADRMGLLPEIRAKGYMVKEVVALNRAGKRVAGFSAEVFERVTRSRFVSVPRGDLAAAIFGKLDARVETIFGDSIRSIDETASGVRVGFEQAPPREFDLVIGADGLHSRVRELVFGPQARFEKYLGYKAAAFEVAGYRPRQELVNVLYTQVHQQVVRFATRNDRTMFFFTFADPDPGGSDNVAEQKALLRARFANSGWECPQILAAMETATNFYFDRVSQIRMDPQQGLWTRGRVSLLGDAAFCVSLLAGQGSSLAMAAAYILAGELHRARGNYAEAFANYQNRFGPFVLGKQNSALRLAGTFAPKSKFALFLRNQVFNLMSIGWIANLAIGRSLIDRIELPAY